jgi:hypothetical protein
MRNNKKKVLMAPNDAIETEKSCTLSFVFMKETPDFSSHFCFFPASFLHDYRRLIKMVSL